MSLIKK